MINVNVFKSYRWSVLGSYIFYWCSIWSDTRLSVCGHAWNLYSLYAAQKSLCLLFSLQMYSCSVINLHSSVKLVSDTLNSSLHINSVSTSAMCPSPDVIIQVFNTRTHETLTVTLNHRPNISIQFDSWSKVHPLSWADTDSHCKDELSAAKWPCLSSARLPQKSDSFSSRFWKGSHRHPAECSQEEASFWRWVGLFFLSFLFT